MKTVHKTLLLLLVAVPLSMPAFGAEVGFTEATCADSFVPAPCETAQKLSGNSTVIASRSRHLCSISALKRADCLALRHPVSFQESALNS